VFQELFGLPRIDGEYVQLCTFSSAGTFAGSCVRIDPSMVITTDSDIVALRVVSDREFLEDFAAPQEGYEI
jgi:glutathionylspermidine amidase/synthetase